MRGPCLHQHSLQALHSKYGCAQQVRLCTLSDARLMHKAAGSSGILNCSRQDSCAQCLNRDCGADRYVATAGKVIFGLDIDPTKPGSTVPSEQECWDNCCKSKACKSAVYRRSDRRCWLKTVSVSRAEDGPAWMHVLHPKGLAGMHLHVVPADSS